MSADKWSICPRCTDVAMGKYSKAQAEVAELPEHIRKLVKLEPPNYEDYRSFREEYEFYLDKAQGRITWSFSGHCTQCSLGIDFDGKSEQFYKGE